MIAHNGQKNATQKTYTQNDSPGGSTDLTPWCALKLVHQGAAPDLGGVFFRTREEKID